jgi:hypothetical protein
MKTLEGEIHLVIAKGEDQKVYANPAEGMWFGSINQGKSGQAINFTGLTKQGQEYANHVNRLLTLMV